MLQEYRLEDNTVVFVTSDNGAHDGEDALRVGEDRLPLGSAR